MPLLRSSTTSQRLPCFALSHMPVSNGEEHIIKISKAEPHCQAPMVEYECLLDDSTTNLIDRRIRTCPNPVSGKIFIEMENLLKVIFKYTI